MPIKVSTTFSSQPIRREDCWALREPRTRRNGWAWDQLGACGRRVQVAIYLSLSAGEAGQGGSQTARQWGKRAV